jgi:hypothetical protein
VVARGDVAMQQGAWASWMVVEKEMMWRVDDAKSSIGKHRRSFWKSRGKNDTYTIIFVCYIIAVWLSGKMLLLAKLLM